MIVVRLIDDGFTSASVPFPHLASQWVLSACFALMLQSGGKASPEAVVTKVTVDAPDFSTAGTMFQDALKSLRAAPSLLWLDLPCKYSCFDRGDEAAAATIWATERRRENGMGNGIDGPTGDGHWRSVVEVW